MIILCCLAGCIDPYSPDLGKGTDMLVINGRITNQEGYQYVEVSRSSDISNPERRPVSGCSIQIVDDCQNIFTMTEINEGRYACQMNNEDLITGTKYKLFVQTPDNRHYQSDFEELLACPPIDSITYEVTQKEMSYPGRNADIVQFYIYTDASGEYAQSYLWEMTETWEYHSKFPIAAYYDGAINVLDNLSYEYYTCFKSGMIDEIYTHSTRNVSDSRIQKFPLNYVSDETNRLSEKYSLNVRQYSLSDKAYNYLTVIRKLSKETGGIYETQPSGIPGNIINQDDPEEQVLGMFYASSITEKRIFVTVRFQNYNTYCVPYGFSVDELFEYLAGKDELEYPVYLLMVDFRIFDYADPECFDCRRYGGSTRPPDFWE